LSAQPLARQFGIFRPGGDHGCMRDGLEPVCHQSRPDPLALRGRLGVSFARFLGGTRSLLHGLKSKVHSYPEISGKPYKAAELLREVLVAARADLFRDIFVGRLADLESSAGETGMFECVVLAGPGG